MSDYLIWVAAQISKANGMREDHIMDDIVSGRLVVPEAYNIDIYLQEVANENESEIING